MEIMLRMVRGNEGKKKGFGIRKLIVAKKVLEQG